MKHHKLEHHGIANLYKGPAFGLEFEMENLQGTDLRFFGALGWEIVRDGSLRAGVDAAREFVSPPLPFWEAMEVGTAFSNYSFENFASSRTSIHVHQNIKYLYTDELLIYIALLVMLDLIIVDHFYPERKHKNFCRPVCYDIRTLEALMVCGAEQDGYHVNMFDVCNKYSSINMRGIGAWGLGTIEFRFLGLEAANRLKELMIMTMKLTRYAQDLAYHKQDESFVDIIHVEFNEFITNPIKYFSKFVPNTVGLVNKDYREVASFVYNQIAGCNLSNAPDDDAVALFETSAEFINTIQEAL